MTIGQLSRFHRTTEPLGEDNSTVGIGQVNRPLGTTQPSDHRTTEPSPTVEIAVKHVLKHDSNLSAGIGGAGYSSAGLAARQALVAPPLAARLGSASVSVEKDEDKTYSRFESETVYPMRARGTVTVAPEPLPVPRYKYVPVATEDEERKPLANKYCYPELYAEWKRAGGKLPKCRRCKRTIQWEEHHACPGYIPDPTRLNTKIDPETRMAMRRASWDDWDDDQYDPTSPGDADWMMHEAETGETRDQVVIEGMTEEEYLMEKFGYLP